MDRRLALIALCALPVFAGLLYWLTGVFDPLTGYAVGMVCYWLLLAALILTTTTEPQCLAWIEARAPGTLITFGCLMPVVAVAAVGMPLLDFVPVPVVLAISIAALVNATVEEVFWRGAILPEPSRPEAAMAVVLFSFWHVAFLTAQGVTQAGGAVGFLIGATVFGTFWMESRLKTGTLGFGILCHAGVNLFAFIIMYATNMTAG